MSRDSSCMNRVSLWTLCGVLLVCLNGCQEALQYEPYEASGMTRSMKVGESSVDVEIAADPQTRRRGLMKRDKMPESHGMIFMYPTERVLHFWMKNTYLPLSIAFFNDDGVITNIEHMEPLVEEPGATSVVPVKYALEVNRGWFAKHGVKAGSRIEIPEWFKDIVPQEDR